MSKRSVRAEARKNALRTDALALKLRVALVHRRVQFGVGDATAGRNRRVHHGTQRAQLRLPLLDQAQSLAHQLARRSVPAILHRLLDETLPAIPYRHVHDCTSSLEARIAR